MLNAIAVRISESFQVSKKMLAQTLGLVPEVCFNVIVIYGITER